MTGREPGQPQTGAYIAENEHGTPFLYFPDGGETDGFYRREATAAEVVFWAKCGRLQERVRELETLASALRKERGDAREVGDRG